MRLLGRATPGEAGCHVGCVGSRQSIVRQCVGYACDAGFYSRYPLNIDLNIVVSGDMFRNVPTLQPGFLSTSVFDVMTSCRLTGSGESCPLMFQRSKGVVSSKKAHIPAY